MNILRIFKHITAAMVLSTLVALDSAAAGGIVDKAAEAEALAAQGKYAEAMAALDGATAALWKASPLTFRRVLWASAKPAGFGHYKVRGPTWFYPTDTLIAYVEPIGISFRTFDIYFAVDLSADVVVRTADGKEVFSKVAFERQQVFSRSPTYEFMTCFDYGKIGISTPGDYVVETTVHDLNSGKSGSFSLPFTIIPLSAPQ